MDVLLDVAFWACGVVAVVSGALVFRFDSMARATYALAVSFVAVGADLLLLHLDYVGLITVLMMVMEMAVMAVYMVMFMGMNPALMPMSMVHGRRPALAAGVLAFAGLAAVAVLVPWPARRGAPTGDQVRALGEAVMGPKMLVMMAVSAVMVATIVAGVSLAVARGRYELRGDDLRRSPAAPEREGVAP